MGDMIKAFWEIKGKRLKANLFLRQFYQMLYIHLANASASIKRIDGSSVSVGAGLLTFKCITGENDTNLGIVCGSGSTTPDLTDFKLESLIPATSLYYSANVVSLTNSYVEVYRSVKNITTSDLTIRELGLYVNTGSATYYFCIERTVLPSFITLAPNEELPIRFKIYA